MRASTPEHSRPNVSFERLRVRTNARIKARGKEGINVGPGYFGLLGSMEDPLANGNGYVRVSISDHSRSMGANGLHYEPDGISVIGSIFPGGVSEALLEASATDIQLFASMLPVAAVLPTTVDRDRKLDLDGGASKAIALISPSVCQSPSLSNDATTASLILEMNIPIIVLVHEATKRSRKFKNMKKKKNNKKNKPYSPPVAAIEDSTKGSEVNRSCDLGSANPVPAGSLARHLFIWMWEVSHWLLIH